MLIKQNLIKKSGPMQRLTDLEWPISPTKYLVRKHPMPPRENLYCAVRILISDLFVDTLSSDITHNKNIISLWKQQRLRQITTEDLGSLARARARS